ncbi:putative 3',5'-cyclic phosphodiesterase [Neospora caninum Liverpool]|uniref:Phosphodiesterase n=1 Tax=Neospora caninum (strain Liverpool) TaxID=572307 RepID=F0VEP1_NEOCL|nr:putative 3',5'-cyclic phosphodiesterase [Neospora caninum Liverpool]CBZ52185.1 putative 3',5'-cyclic phosphodiesterase [Neospora caninum Liverpool]|eukprot:XP_003882217.1 putative 3',5'-cyclic phosphodiesterase [Neospora caninum Liverpool]
MPTESPSTAAADALCAAGVDSPAEPSAPKRGEVPVQPTSSSDSLRQPGPPASAEASTGVSRRQRLFPQHAKDAEPPADAPPQKPRACGVSRKTGSPAHRSPLAALTSFAFGAQHASRKQTGGDLEAPASSMESCGNCGSGSLRSPGIIMESVDEDDELDAGAGSLSFTFSSQWNSREGGSSFVSEPVPWRVKWENAPRTVTRQGDATVARGTYNMASLRSPPMSCIVSMEEKTVPVTEDWHSGEGVGVVKAAEPRKNSGQGAKVIRFREADSEVSAPTFSDPPSLSHDVGQRELDLEDRRSNGEAFVPMRFFEGEEDEEEEESKRAVGRSETGDPGWHGMRWRWRSMWRFVKAINNDEATMKHAAGPYCLLRGCDLKCFPLSFKERRAECEYRNFNVCRVPLRLVIMFPILCAIYAVSYGTCRRFCSDCYLAAPFEGELVVSILLLTVATLGAHLYLLYNHLELFVVLSLCLLSTYRSAMRIATLAGAVRDPAGFRVIFPYYGINGILESFLLCFTIVTFLGVRFAYALWATLCFLACAAPIAILSLHLSVQLVQDPERVWSDWEALLHVLPFLLIILMLVSAYYEERKKRILFWNLRTADSRLTLLEHQVQHRRYKRQAVMGTPFDCILSNLSEALEQLKKPKAVDREEIFAVIQESLNMLTTSENVYQVQAAYVDNDFTRSFIRDLRMHSRDVSDFAVSRLNTLATRRRSVASGKAEASRTELLEDIGNAWDANMFMLRMKVSRPLVEVCHLSICLLEMLRLRESLGDLEEASLIIATLCHDIAHPGRNNNFMVNANTPLALTYNDISVLENMHASLTFRLLRDPRLNLLNHLQREAYRSFRMTVIELILSTDMKTHFEQITNFRVRRQKDEFDPISNYDDRQKVLSMIIKSADIGHGTLPWADHERWCELVVQEFYEQGDEEKRMGLAVSFLCDRNQHDTEFFKSQVGFLDFVVKPLYEELAALETQLNLNPELPIEKICLKNLHENISEWQKKDAERQAVLGDSGAPEETA